MHASDGQMDGRTEFSSQDRVCIPCSAVKTNKQQKKNYLLDLDSVNAYRVNARLQHYAQYIAFCLFNLATYC